MDRDNNIIEASVKRKSAKFSFRGNTLVLFVTLMTMIVPGAALILPLYLEMSAVGLVNTPWSVILPGTFYPFGVYMIYLFAKNAIPDSIIEAARLDGASEFGIFMRIFLPLARPGLIVAFLLVFIPALSELSATILLYTGGTETISVAIFRLNDLGQLEVVSALAVFTIAMILLVSLPLNWLSNRANASAETLAR